MQLVIFGSSGFIGRNLLKSLSLNASVHTVSLRKPSWENDIEDSSNIFINLIGKAHDHKGTATEDDYYFVNVELTKQVFEVFKKSNAKLFIHISSLAALEEFKSTKPLEEDDYCRPVSFYGKSKRQAEEWLLEQELPIDKKIIIIRPPMVHGPGDKGNLALLYKIISKGIPYPLSAFKNNRSFISINNFVFYINKIIEKSEELDNGIYHISDNETASTDDIIAIIKNVENIKMPNVNLPKFFVKGIAKLGDFLPIPLNTKKLNKMTSDLLVSSEKIKKALSIHKLPLTAKEGLEITIQSFKK